MTFFKSGGGTHNIEKVPVNGGDTHHTLEGQGTGTNEIPQAVLDANYRMHQIESAKTRKVPNYETMGKVVLLEEDLEIQKQMDTLVKGKEFRSLFPAVNVESENLDLEINEDYGFKSFVEAHNTIFKLSEEQKTELVTFMVNNVLSLPLEARGSGEFYKDEFYLGDFYREVREKSSEQELQAWVINKNNTYNKAIEMAASGIIDKVLELRKKENKFSVSK